ncbi:hypothetical protein GCM10009838_15210 [Catenulispora subtropica]|uniref:Uncharacterized protein n=2 Tax=Catenulispora subtropica TaxID=450798 RepID=A0ABP5CE00_9ACTN
MRVTRLFTSLSAGAAALAMVVGPTGMSTAQAAATSPGFEVSFQAPSGQLAHIDPGGTATLTSSFMAAQTSPSIAALPDGTFDEAFNAWDRTLWFGNSVAGGHQVVQSACSPDPYIVTPGTSPSLAVDKQGIQDFLISEGGTETSIKVPIQDQVCSSSEGDILSGTSPSVAALNVGPATGGFIFVETWVGSDGLVRVREPGKGTHIAGNGLRAEPGTNPSVAPGINGRWKLAYQGTDNHLWTVNSDGVTDRTPSVLTPGTSPAIAGLADGGFEMAFVASDGTLWADLNGNGHRVAGPVNVAPGSNAAIGANNADSWEIAVPRSGDHHLLTVNPGDAVRDTGQTAATGTSPAVAGLFPVAAGTTGTETLTLTQQQTVNGFIPFTGKFPPTGITQPGKVLSITYPGSGFPAPTLLFVKSGHTTAECGNPSAVIALPQGQTTTAAQMSAIFGTATSFSSLSPFGAVACFSGPNPTPSFINLSMNVQFD